MLYTTRPSIGDIEAIWETTGTAVTRMIDLVSFTQRVCINGIHSDRFLAHRTSNNPSMNQQKALQVNKPRSLHGRQQPKKMDLASQPLAIYWFVLVHAIM